MKTKLKFLTVLFLMVILVGATTGTAAAFAGIITIGPDALSGAYETQYSQQLTAIGGTQPYTFSLLSGTLPTGITLDSDGLLSGYPDSTGAKPGTFPITIQVKDANSVTASRAYDFVLAKGIPTVEVYAPESPYWNSPFSVSAEVSMPFSSTGAYVLSGTVAFTIDGNAVPGCSAVPLVDAGYSCAGISMNLSVGAHTVNADFTPTDSDYYSTANASRGFIVQTSYYNIAGTIFNDQDQDGILDPDEYGLSGFTVNLDQDCDGTVDENYTTSYFGSYQFYNLAGGKCYRITVQENPGWQQTTTQLPDISSLSGNTLSENIGFYYPTITLSPSALPDGTVGQAYSQVLTASGGTEPYTYTLDTRSTMPDGLTLSEDGTLSGIPTTNGKYFIKVLATDVNQAVGYKYYNLTINVNGNFTFTSSSNPSSQGDPVTFTVSATGNAVDDELNPIPPTGLVTFFADGTPIEGCTGLNLNFSKYTDGNFRKGFNPATKEYYPAKCTTAALAVGSHQITAEFTDYTSLYNTPTLALTQDVQVVTTDLSIGLTNSKGLVKPGTKLVYTIKVINTGPDLAQDITLVDKLDRDTTYVSISAPMGWSCKYANFAVTCTSSSLASGGSAIIKVTVMVNRTAHVGKNIVNNANVSCRTFDPVLTNQKVVQKTMVSK